MTNGRASGDPVVSVIIPHRDTPESLDGCLASLAAQEVGFAFEIIVVDSSSLAPCGIGGHPRLSLLTSPPNGPGPARNSAAAVARGEFLAFIDADCRVAPGWLASLVETFRVRPDADLLGGRIETRPVDGSDWTPEGLFDMVFSYKQAFFVRRRGFSVTANLAVRAGVFREVGGFAGVDILEDLEWCQRAGELGFRIVYAPEMLVFHEPRPLRELKGRWVRQVHQEYHTYVAGRGAYRNFAWIARVVVFTPAAFAYLMLHPSIGLRDKLRTLPVVWRVRAARVSAMVGLAFNPKRTRPPWNG